MKCEFCGFEAEEEFAFCPNCSKQKEIETNSEPENNSEVLPISLNPAADIVLNALKDKLFLVVCILVSASTIFNLANDVVNIIGILMSVFLWLTYVSAYKGIADENHLRSVSGTYFANYVIMWVGTILVLLMGVLFAVVFGAIATSGELMDSILEELEFGIANELIGSILSISAVWVFVLFTLIGVALMLVLHFAVRPTHRFIQSVYKSVEAGETSFCSANIAKNWLLIGGILSGVSALGSLFSSMSGFLAGAASAAASIIGSILIDKYFIKNILN